MFEIDDTFLANVGYDVATLSDEQKEKYKNEITAEVNGRIIDEMADELSPEQVDDIGGIQDSSERARQWLHEFHGGFEQDDDYKAIVSAVGEEEALVFYASSLWFADAVPGYGELIRDILNAYQDELIEKREMASKAFGI